MTLKENSLLVLPTVFIEGIYAYKIYKCIVVRVAFSSAA
jgi:hypothetical protein